MSPTPSRSSSTAATVGGTSPAPSLLPRRRIRRRPSLPLPNVPTHDATPALRGHSPGRYPVFSPTPARPARPAAADLPPEAVFLPSSSPPTTTVQGESFPAGAVAPLSAAAAAAAAATEQRWVAAGGYLPLSERASVRGPMMVEAAADEGGRVMEVERNERPWATRYVVDVEGIKGRAEAEAEARKRRRRAGSGGSFGEGARRLSGRVKRLLSFSEGEDGKK